MSALKGDLVSTREAASILGITEGGVRYHHDKGHLSKWGDGTRHVWFRRAEVLELKSCRETLRLVS